MSGDVMRLSDLVPEYARYYRVGTQDAAYALHELFVEMDSEQGRTIPDDVMWIGRVGSSAPAYSAKVLDIRVLEFSNLAKYFSDSAGLSCNSESRFVGCTYIVDGCIEHKYIPPSMVYLSKPLLGKLIYDATSQALGFLVNNTPSLMLHSNTDKGLTTKERNSVAKIIKGLVDLVQEVGKAYSDQPLDDKARKRADSIKRDVSRIINPSRKKQNLPLKIRDLADVAGVEMVRDPETLRRYMDDEDSSS